MNAHSIGTKRVLSGDFGNTEPLFRRFRNQGVCVCVLV